MAVTKRNYVPGEYEAITTESAGTIAANTWQYFVLDGYYKFAISDVQVYADGVLVPPVDYDLATDVKYTDIEDTRSGKTIYSQIRVTNATHDGKALTVTGNNFGSYTDNEATAAQAGADIEYVDFDTTLPAPPAHNEGRFFYDSENHTVSSYSDIVGPIMQHGQEIWKRVKNITGATIANGKVVYVNGEDSGVSTVALAKADAAETCQGTIGFATHDIPNGTEGWVTLIGAVREVSIIGPTSGTIIYLSATTAGAWTSIIPESPDFVVKLGTVSVSGSSGIIDANIEVRDNQQDLIQYYNGAFLTPRTVDVTSDGVTVTVSLEASGGGDIYLFFDGDIVKVDTTPALTASLNAGTNIAPIRNYVYILKSAPTVLTVSTSGWPSEEHARVCDTLVQSAADVQTNEVYKQHEWTDHLTSGSGQGHSTDINYWIRQQHATYQSGIGVTISGSGTGTIGLSNTAGVALQLHPHAFPAFTNPARVLIVNDQTTAYLPVTNLGITTDTTGASLNNKTFACVLWAVVSEEAGQCKWMMNKPGGSYNNADDARTDALGYGNYTIPDSFKGCGILVHRLVMKLAGGTYTVYSDDSDDLRGQLPNTTAGGSVGSGAQNLEQVMSLGPETTNTLLYTDPSDSTRKTKIGRVVSEAPVEAGTESTNGTAGVRTSSEGYMGVFSNLSSLIGLVMTTVGSVFRISRLSSEGTEEQGITFNTDGTIDIDEPTTTESDAQNATRGSQALASYGGIAQGLTWTSVTPSAGYTLNATNPMQYALDRFGNLLIKGRLDVTGGTVDTSVSNDICTIPSGSAGSTTLWGDAQLNTTTNVVKTAAYVSSAGAVSIAGVNGGGSTTCSIIICESLFLRNR